MIFPLVFLAAYQRSAQVDPDTLRLHLDDVLWAAEQCGIPSVEKLAVHLEMDREQLRRQFNGEGHFSYTRLVSRMPPQFWGYLGWRLSCRFGLPSEARKAAGLWLALAGTKRMAKASASKTAKRRTA